MNLNMIMSRKEAILLITLSLLQTAVALRKIYQAHALNEGMNEAFSDIATYTEDKSVDAINELFEEFDKVTASMVNFQIKAQQEARAHLQRSYVQWVNAQPKKFFSNRDVSFAAYKKEFGL